METESENDFVDYIKQSWDWWKDNERNQDVDAFIIEIMVALKEQGNLYNEETEWETKAHIVRIINEYELES